MYRIRHAVLSLAMLLALNACLVVDDFGAAWNEAKPDPCLNKIAQSLYSGEFSRDSSSYNIEEIARGWSIKNHHFLLLKKTPTDAGGRLYRFTVTNGIFNRFRLAPTMRDQFERDYPNAAVKIRRDTVTLEDLSTTPRTLLASISAIPDYWEVEDKVLYNTLLNPACRFEDRDLKKLNDTKGK